MAFETWKIIISKRRKYNQISNPFVKLCIDIESSWEEINIMMFAMLLFHPQRTSHSAVFCRLFLPKLLFLLSLSSLPSFYWIVVYDFHLFFCSFMTFMSNSKFNDLENSKLFCDKKLVHKQFRNCSMIFV